jgi:hypothetical protein
MKLNKKNRDRMVRRALTLPLYESIFSIAEEVMNAALVPEAVFIDKQLYLQSQNFRNIEIGNNDEARLT